MTPDTYTSTPPPRSVKVAPCGCWGVTVSDGGRCIRPSRAQARSLRHFDGIAEIHREECAHAPKIADHVRDVDSVHEEAAESDARRGRSDLAPTHPCFDEDFQPSEAVLTVLRQFKKSKPFKCDEAGFVTKLSRLFNDLAQVYNFPAPKVRHVGSWTGGSSYEYDRGTHSITLNGRRSVITALHAFRAAMGYNIESRVRWSVNYFQRVWPKAFNRLVNPPGTYLMVRPENSF